MDLKLILESLLFTSQKPLSPVELRDVLTRSADEEGASEEIRSLRKLDLEVITRELEELTREHEAAARSYRLVCVAGSWQFVTQPEFAPWLRTFLGVKPRPVRLSQPALETLAIIAYRQPITRAEIEQIRGVAVDGVIATLRERLLIFEVGRAELVGRPMQYGTTAAFLEYFGLGRIEDLPAADELRRIPVQRPESLLTVENAPPEVATDPAQAQLSMEPVDPAMDGALASDPSENVMPAVSPPTEPAESTPPAM